MDIGSTSSVPYSEPTDLPMWARSFRKIALIQPSSAAAERVFSILQSSFGKQSLEDYIQLSVMLQYNFERIIIITKLRII